MLLSGRSLKCLWIMVSVSRHYTTLLVAKGFDTQELKLKQRNSFENISTKFLFIKRNMLPRQSSDGLSGGTSAFSFYLISDRLREGHTSVEQRWSYEDFCDVTIRLEDYTYALNRQVEVIALVRSFRPMPVDEFDRKVRPLII